MSPPPPPTSLLRSAPGFVSSPVGPTTVFSIRSASSPALGGRREENGLQQLHAGGEEGPLERTGGRGPFLACRRGKGRSQRQVCQRPLSPPRLPPPTVPPPAPFRLPSKKKSPLSWGTNEPESGKKRGETGTPLSSCSSTFVTAQFHLSNWLANKVVVPYGGKRGRGHLGLHPQMSFRGVLLRRSRDVFERKREGGRPKCVVSIFAFAAPGRREGPGDDASASPIFFPFSPRCACVEKVGRGGGLECVFLTHKDKQQQQPVLPKLGLKKSRGTEWRREGRRGSSLFICVVYAPLFFRRPVRSVQKRRRAGFSSSRTFGGQNGPLFPPPLSSRP